MSVFILVTNLPPIRVTEEAYAQNRVLFSLFLVVPSIEGSIFKNSRVIEYFYWTHFFSFLFKKQQHKLHCLGCCWYSYYDGRLHFDGESNVSSGWVTLLPTWIYIISVPDCVTHTHTQTKPPTVLLIHYWPLRNKKKLLPLRFHLVCGFF